MAPKRKHAVGKWEQGDADILKGWVFDFIFSYPDEIDETFETLKAHLTLPDNKDMGPIVVHFLCRIFRKEAEAILINSGYRDILDDLSEPEFHDSLFSYQDASAKRVLISSEKLLHSISKNDSEEAALEMFHLTMAAIRANIFKITFDEINRIKGKIAGGRAAKKLIGIEAAIIDLLTEDNMLTVHRVWTKQKKHTSTCPLIIKDFEVYIDGEEIVQIDKGGNEKK